MKKALLITTLVAASSVGAWAGTARLNMFANGDIDKLNNDEFSTGWTYRDVQQNKYGENQDGTWVGDVKFDGVHNSSRHPLHLTHHRENVKIDLGRNARYELGFSFRLNQAGQGNGDQAMAGMYLAGNGGSVFFGNAQLNAYTDRREAVMVKYNTNIADYNDNAGAKVYFPNDEFSYKISSPYDYTSPVRDQWLTVFDGNNNAFDTGAYRLEVVIESFSDPNKKDLLYLYASTPEGTAYQWYEIETLGFEASAVFEAYGFVLHNDGTSTAVAERMSGYEYSREEIVDSNVPEPSAFGLLAGLGAIALGVSRRRRVRV